jgi:hypothetical protein
MATNDSGPIPSASDPRLLRRVAISSLRGTAVESHSFLLYATMTALVFDRVFFPLLVSSLLVGNLRGTPLVIIAMCCGAVTIVPIWRISETRGRNLNGNVRSRAPQASSSTETQASRGDRLI